jgi:hypothetical protein
MTAIRARDVYDRYGADFLGYIPNVRVLELVNQSRTWLHNRPICFDRFTAGILSAEGLLQAYNAGDCSKLYYDTVAQATLKLFRQPPHEEYKTHLFDALRVYPLNRDNASFYVFKKFVVDDCTDGCHWRPYTIRASWHAVTDEQLVKLPREEVIEDDVDVFP